MSVYLCRAGEEWPLRPVAFAFHGVWRHCGILNAAASLPTLPDVVRQIARWWKANQELFGKVHGEAEEFAPSLEAVQESA